MNKEEQLKSREDTLRYIIEDTIWLAARYAHGRHTYAPSIVRGAIKSMKLLFPDWKPRQDKTIEPPMVEPKYKSYRQDYLDDIFNYEGKE